MATGDIVRRRVNTVEDLALWVKEMVRRERMRYRVVWTTWLENLLAFHGENDFKVTEELRLYSRLTAKRRKVLERINVNFVGPHVRTMASKLQRAKPILECLPSTSDEEDVLAAKVGDRLLRGEWYNQGLDMVRLQSAVWMFSVGNAFIHTFFDPWKGVSLGNGAFTGEICSQAVNPFKIIFEPNRTEFSKVRWAIIQERLPVDEVLEKYERYYYARTSKMLDMPEAATEDTDDVSDAYMQLLDGRRATDCSESVEVRYLYHVPTAWYPTGRYAILTGDEVLYEGPYPYPFLGRLPIIHLQEILSPWRLYGDTACTEVHRTQNHYNELRRLEHEYHTDDMRAFWTMKKGTRVRKKSLIDHKNRVIEWDGNTPPQKQPGQNMPNSMYNSIELSRKEVERSGLADVSHAIPAQGVTSGKAILALQEQDDVKLMMTSQLMEHEYGKLGQNILLMAKNFYKHTRKFSMVGESLGGSVFLFDRANLRGTTDVRCVEGTALPLNKIAKQEQVKEHIAMGLYGSPEEAVVRARKVLDIGLTEDVFDDDTLDAQVQERENIWMVQTAKQLVQSGVQDMAMYRGAVMPVSPVDNHLVHIKCLLRRAKTPGVRDVPAVLAVLVAHLQLHQQAMNPQQAAVLQGEQAGQPAGGQGQSLQPQQNENLQGQPTIVEQPPQGGVASNDLNQGGQ